MNFRKYLFYPVAIIGLALSLSLPAAAQIAGESGIANIPTTIAANGVTNPPATSGNAIDCRGSRNVSISLYGALTVASTTNTVKATYAFSNDGANYDSTKTFTLLKVPSGLTAFFITTNVDTAGYLYLIPVSFTNDAPGAVGILTNWGAKYAMKPNL